MSSRTLLLTGVLLVFVSPLAAPSKDKAPVAATRTLAVIVQDGLAYVGQTGGLVIRDVSDPTRPIDVSWLPLPGTVSDVLVEGSHAFLAAGTRGLVIVDISDPAAPVEIARLDTDGKVKRIARAGDHAFLADGRGGLLVVDVTSLEDPRVRARISTSGEVRALAISGDMLALAEGHAGARVLSLRRPENPQELRKLDTNFPARDVCWIGDRLFVAAGSEGTAVYQPKVSARPLTFLPPVRSAQHVACGKKLVAVSNLGSAMQLFDVEDDGLPRERSRLRVHRSAPIGRADFADSQLWIAVDVAGMGLLDVRDASNPERVLPRTRKFKVSY
jgi:hypothetical protein